jgi:cathepsin L
MFAIFSLLSLSCVSTIPNSEMNFLFKNYIRDYNKKYSHDEYYYRYKIFSENYNYIVNKNENISYTLGLNNFTDISRSEFNKIYLSGLVYNNHYNSNYLYHNNSNTSISSSIDWRAAGIVTNVKNQEMCGSCWAFSTTGTLEGQHALNSGHLVSLSEQNLVDCSTRNFGCGGGWPSIAMGYIKRNGIDSESSYKYAGVDESCEFNKSNVASFLNNVVLVESGNMTSLYDSIGTVGPISIAIDAEDDFQFYKSGIYNSTLCSNSSLNHAVLAVGYSSYQNNSFIIVKNSWGSDWGMDGYIYMSTNISNMCGMATNASYPLINH